MKLYFYNDGIEPKRTTPLCEFSGDCNHELIVKLDQVLFVRYGRMNAGLLTQTVKVGDHEPFEARLVNVYTGEYYGTAYVVEDEPAVISEEERKK